MAPQARIPKPRPGVIYGLMPELLQIAGQVMSLMKKNKKREQQRANNPAKRNPREAATYTGG